MAHINSTTAVLALVLLAVGCTTSPNDAKSKAPTLELSSSKSAKIVAVCIAEKWEDLYRLGTLNIRPTINGFSVIQQDPGITGKDFPCIADIEDRNSGSFTKYYNNAFSAKKIDQAVIECQK